MLAILSSSGSTSFGEFCRPILQTRIDTKCPNNTCEYALVWGNYLLGPSQIDLKFRKLMQELFGGFFFLNPYNYIAREMP